MLGLLTHDFSGGFTAEYRTWLPIAGHTLVFRPGRKTLRSGTLRARSS